MVFDVSPVVFFGIYIPLLVGWWRIYSRFKTEKQKLVDKYANKIREYNSMNNIDNSVSKQALARDFLSLTSDSSIDRICRENKLEKKKYIKELRKSIGLPNARLLPLLLIPSFLYVFFGVSYFLPGGIIPADWYLISSIIITVFSGGVSMHVTEKY